MRRPILVGFDPRGSDRAPVDFGATLARLTGAPLVIVSVQAFSPVVPISATQSLQYAIAQVDDDLLADCSEAVEHLEAELAREGVQASCRRRNSTSAARGLHEAAEEEDAALIVAGSGSTAERLLHGAPCPVAVVPAGWGAAAGFRTVGAAYVDSDEGRAALRAAFALAHHLDASLRVITVVRDEQRPAAEEALRLAVDTLANGVTVEGAVLIGDPAERLAEASAELDLMVCGSRGYGPIRAVLLGSVSRRLVSEARCPLVVVPRGIAAPLKALLAEATGAAAGA